MGQVPGGSRLSVRRRGYRVVGTWRWNSTTVRVSKAGLPGSTRLVGPAGVTDYFRGHDGSPSQGWIPAFAGTTDVGDLGRVF